RDRSQEVSMVNRDCDRGKARSPVCAWTHGPTADWGPEATTFAGDRIASSVASAGARLAQARAAAAIRLARARVHACREWGRPGAARLRTGPAGLARFWIRA